MDMLSIILVLRPQLVGVTARPNDPAPFWWGRAAQALLLSSLAKRDAALADHLHNDQGPRPYTVSTLLGRFPRQQLDPGSTYTLRLTAYEPGLAAHLLDITLPGSDLGPGSTIELDRRAFQVEQAIHDADQHPWAGQTDYSALAAAHLAQAAPSRRIAMHWASPVTFRSGGRDLPLPVPELVFGSLLERWNSYSPVALPDEVRRYAAECVGVSRYALKTSSAPLKNGAQRIGAAGEVSFVALTYDRYWMSALHTLAAFSIYAGLGAGTAHGMGQCRVVDSP